MEFDNVESIACKTIKDDKFRCEIGETEFTTLSLEIRKDTVIKRSKISPRSFVAKFKSPVDLKREAGSLWIEED